MSWDKNKIGVVTSYKMNQRKYASYIIGANKIEIKRKLSKRKLSESIESKIQKIEIVPTFKELNDYEFLFQLPNIIHLSVYLGFICLKAGTMRIDNILGDEGILHEMTHLMTNSVKIEKKSIRRVRQKFEELKRKAVGVY